MAKPVTVKPVKHNTNFRRNRTLNNQTRFLEAWYEHHGSIDAALKATGVGRECYNSWLRRDSDFVKRLTFKRTELVKAIEAKVLDMAVKGDRDMAKFVLSNLEPETYDQKLRSTKFLAERDRERWEHERKSVSIEELRQILLADPMQQHTAIDITPAEVSALPAPEGATPPEPDKSDE